MKPTYCERQTVLSVLTCCTVCGSYFYATKPTAAYVCVRCRQSEAKRQEAR